MRVFELSAAARAAREGTEGWGDCALIAGFSLRFCTPGVLPAAPPEDARRAAPAAFTGAGRLGGTAAPEPLLSPVTTRVLVSWGIPFPPVRARPDSEAAVGSIFESLLPKSPVFVNEYSTDGALFAL